MYKLSCEILGHSMDVRGVSHSNDGQILSCSRDLTARIWEIGSCDEYEPKAIFEGRSEFVSSICYIEPSENYPDGLVATGGNDSVIMCYNPEKGQRMFCLHGHKETVCCLVPTCHSTSHLLSSSWDKTVICWDLQSRQVLFTLQGHTQAVWCVLQLECGLILTGSGDKTIRVYTSSGIYKSTLAEGHTDCVRSFSALSDSEFVSAGNDGRLICWKMPEGVKTQSVMASSSFIYCVAYIKSIDTIVCGGESQGIFFHNRETKKTCVLFVPSISVWSITILPNSDIVLGCSDGVIRVYTKDLSRQAPESSTSVNTECVPAAALEPPETKPCGNLIPPNLNDLGGPELLNVAARHIDDMRIVRHGFHAILYCWNGVEWVEVGRKLGTYNPKESVPIERSYYNFNIDVEDGKPHIPLSFNVSDDPWDVADEFVTDHRLPQQYIQQIVDFIIRNVKDDFQNAVPPSKENKYFPLESYILFEKSSPAMLKKIEEYNEKVEESKKIDPQMYHFLKVMSESGIINTEAAATLRKMLSWPPEYSLPVLDLLRLCIRFSKVNSTLTASGEGEKLIDVLISYINNSYTDAPLALVSMRVISNMLAHNDGIECVVEKRNDIVKSIKEIIVPPNPPASFQVALSTLILNLATLSKYFMGLRADCLMCTQRLLTVFTEKEALLRIFSTIGTLISFCGSGFIPQATLATILEHTQSLNLADSHANSCLMEILGILVQ